MAFFGGGASVNLASPTAIGSTTPNTGAFTTLSANNGTITTSTPALTLTQTWNASAVQFSALKIDVTNTASNANSYLIDCNVGGAQVFSVNRSSVLFISSESYGPIINNANSGIGINRRDTSTTAAAIYLGSYSGQSLVTALNFGRIGFSPSSSDCGGGNSLPDTYFTRDAAGAMAQRNATNAQTFRLYNTYTDASNYERASIGWASNVFEINTRNGAAGTGTARPVHITIANNSAFLVNGGFGGGELFAVRNDYMGTGYGAEIGGTGWRGAIRCINLVSNRGISWSNSTSNLSTSDCAISRNSAGVIEINDGNTAGTFRDLIVRNFRMSAPTGVPATAGATGTEGSIRWDADYIYICTAASTWKRVAIATW